MDSLKMYYTENFANSLLQTGIRVNKLYTPILCLVGILGNSLSLAVFWLDPKFRNQSSSLYLSALAISDTGFLLNLFLVWFEGIHGDVITSTFICPLVMYLGQITCFSSVYLTIAFSLERYVAVHYPFSRPRLCTRSKAKRVVFGVISVSLIAFTYVWPIAKVIHVKPSTLSTCDSPELSLFSNFTNITTQDNIKNIIRRHYDFSIHNESEAIHDEQGFKEFLMQYLGLTFPSLENTHNGTIPPSGGNSSPRAACYYQCTVPVQFYEVSEIANYLDSIFTLVLPFILITYLNLSIYKSVWRYINERHQNGVPSRIHSTALNVLTAPNRGSSDYPHISPKPSSSSASSSRSERKSEKNLFSGRGPKKVKRAVRFEMNCCSPASSSGNPRATTTEDHPSRRPSRCANLCQVRSIEQEHFAVRLTHAPLEVRVTKTLLLVSTVFLVLNLPLHVIRCAQFIMYMSGRQSGMDIIRAIQPWATLLFNTNFAVNFLLYCLSGRNFRKSLNRTIISRLVWKKSPPHRVPEELSFQRNPSGHSGQFSSGFVKNWAKMSSESGAAQGIPGESAVSPSFPAEILELDELVPFGMLYAQPTGFSPKM